MTKKNTLNKLKSREREVRENLIMDAAEYVFATIPFDKVSMREIADVAGMATSSIYTYFPNQEALFVGTTLRNHNDLLNILREAIDKNKKNLKIEIVINTFLDFINENESYFRMMAIFMTKGNLSEESTVKVNETAKQTFDLFDELFEKISSPDPNRRLISHYFFTLLNGLLVSYRKLPGRSDEELLNHMKRIGKLAADMIRSLNHACADSA